MSTGFARCTGAFADFSVYGAGGMYDGYFAQVVRETASDCGLSSALSPPVLSTCAGAMSKKREASSCGNDDDDDDDQSNPRTPATCASAACAAFIASMTDDALQDMSTGFARCTGAFADHSVYYGAGGMYDGHLAQALREMASDCGLPSALSPLSGRRRVALKAVEPIGASTFWNEVNAVHRRMALKAVEPIGASTSWNSVHPLRKKYRARLTTLAAVKPSRRTTVARRLISTEGRKPICANGWVWPEPSPPPPSPPPPLPVVTAFIQAEGDVSDYPRPKLAEMEQKVADEVGVGVAAVSITVSAGSVILKVPHGMPQETLT